MERFIPVEIFRKKVILCEVLPFSRFYRNDQNFLCHCLITSARLHVQRKRKLYRYFVNGKTQSCSCFRCQKKYRNHLTETIPRNFRANGKRSISSRISRKRKEIYECAGMFLLNFFLISGNSYASKYLAIRECIYVLVI